MGLAIIMEDHKQLMIQQQSRGVIGCRPNGHPNSLNIIGLALLEDRSWLDDRRLIAVYIRVRWVMCDGD